MSARFSIIASVLTLSLIFASGQEIHQRELFLSPKDFNPHPTQNLPPAEVLKKFIESLRNPIRSKGPVLFPDSPQNPTAKPFIVTARPVLSPSGQAVSQNAYQYEDNYISNNLIDDRYAIDEAKTFEHPYSAVTERAKLLGQDVRRHQYDIYEEQTIVPPIYRALGNHAQAKVLASDRTDSLKTGLGQSRHSNYLGNGGGGDYDYYDDGVKDKHYAFSYAVKDANTGDDFSHSQRHSGQATAGEYRVRLPDGRMQIVSYTADDGGYKADVRYDDPARPEVEANPKFPVQTYRQSIDNIQYNLAQNAESSSKLGRIIVPEDEEYREYYNNQDILYNQYVHGVSATPTPAYFYTTSNAIFQNGGPTPAAILNHGGGGTPAPEVTYQQIAAPEQDVRRHGVYSTVAPYADIPGGRQYYLEIADPREVNRYLGK